MKRFLLAYLSIFFFISNNYAQILRFSYHFDNPKIVNQEEYQLVYFQQTRQLGQLGKPTIPFMPIKLVLPQGTEIKNFQVITKNLVSLQQKINLYPFQAVRPISSGKSGQFFKDKQTYSKHKYPENLPIEISTQYLNGFSIALGNFSPVVYNPAEQQFSYYQDVEIIIELQPSQKAQQLNNMLTTRKNVINRIKNFVQNPELIEKYRIIKNKDELDNYEVLIITNSTYENSFEDLRNLYLMHGLRSQVVSVETINSTVNGRDLPEKIRNYIIEQYQNYQIEYVLLAGDVSIVPYRGFYCLVHSSSDYSDDNIPADLYYSALDGTWNDDNDNLWGEPGEDDLLPEIAVGRMPFDNSSELNNMLHKILFYQTSPVIGELNKPLLAGESLWNNPETWGSDYLRLLIGHHEDNGYTTDGIPPQSPYDSLYDRYGSWSANDIINRINQGRPFVHHVGHSNSDYMMKLDISEITDNNFSSVNGTTHNYTLVYSHGCICGAFDHDDCIAEQSLKISNFAVAELVNSRYGWFDEGTTEGPSQHLHREYIDALYHDIVYQLGAAEMVSKIATAPWVNQENEFEPGAQRWCFYDHNALGDPAMNIWTDNPYDITVNYPNSFVIGYEDNLVSITCNEPVYATCAVVQDGQLVGRGYSFGNQDISVEIWTNATPGQATLYVSGYNILLHQYNVNIGTSENALISLRDVAVNDGNNDDFNYNETLNFILTLRNIGAQPATNVIISAVAPEGNRKYQILSAEENIGTIEADSQVQTQGNIQIKIDYPADYQQDTIIFNVQSDQMTFSKTYIFRYKTPHFTLKGISLVETNGNNNGYLEPGESGQIIFKIKNDGHATSSQGLFNLNIENSNVSLGNNQQNIETIEPNDIATLSFDISLDNDFDMSAPLELTARMQSSAYYLNINASINLGVVSESFETGDFSAFDWQTSGDANWIIDNNVHHNGNYSARSGNITNNQQSVLSINLMILSDGQISFYRKVSSETNYDYLHFYIDNQKIDAWSGEQDWAQMTYDINSGEHTLKWIYTKDVSVNEGSDCGWIDDILFPALGSSETTDGIDTTAKVNNLKRFEMGVYPNPFKDYLRFEFNVNKEENAVITLYNLQGKIVYQTDKKVYRGNNVILLNIPSLQSGIYIYQVYINGKFANGKVIKH